MLINFAVVLIFSVTDGITIHSAFNLKFGFTLEPLSDKKLAEFRESFSELTLLIIDEMSLLNADQLYMIHQRLCQIKQSQELFGGIDVILVGDLMQLPPVQGKYVFQPPVHKQYRAFHDCLPLWNQFDPFLLQHNHRQGESKSWSETLNRIREGSPSEQDIALLKDRITNDPFLNEDAMHVFYTNKEVNDHNDTMLQKLESPEQTFTAIHRVPKGYYPNTTPHGTVGSTQFHQDLKLKKGARCMLIFNVNTIDELVNGASGTVVGFERGKKFVKNAFDCIIVKFDSDSCGDEQRRKYPALSEKYKEWNGTPIFRQELEYFINSQRGKSHSAKAAVIQFPLRVCYASTAHKMQVILKVITA